MTAQTANLFRVEDLEQLSRTRELGENELDALHAVANWIETFVARPNKSLGRDGTVCPFTPGALETKTVWLAPEQIADRSFADILRLVSDYKSLFLDTPPRDGEGGTYKAIVVVFTDVSADRAKGCFDDILQDLAASSYADDGIVLGPFYKDNPGSAIYNPNFHPFTSPVPFLLVRGANVSDWKFFLNDDKWLAIWARRFGVSAVQALAEELRRLRWPATASSNR